jgi:phosphoinositide-3-kinase, regulatory subunit 4
MSLLSEAIHLTLADKIIYMPSFLNRSILETDANKDLKSTGDIELAKLGVMPQTVFLKVKPSDPSSRPMRQQTLKSPNDGGSHDTSLASPPHSQTADLSYVAPFEDLRRRLASINSSSSSVGHSFGIRDDRNFHHSSTVASPPPRVLTVMEDRPPSPTDSVLSATNSSSFRPLSRMQVGSLDSQKAAPYVGSSKTSVTGWLESHSKLQQMDTLSERTGRVSPFPVTQTIRSGVRNQNFDAISSYG